MRLNQGPLSQLKQTINTIKAMSDPNAALQNLVNQNPNVQQAMRYVQENGGDPKTAFYKLAAEKGIDPNEIAKLFK